MQLLSPIVAAGLAAAIVGLILFGVWIATRRRIAAETVGRARDEGARLLESAEREIGARRKEAELTAREQAQNLRHETENHARGRREELAALERDLNERKRALADRSAGVDRAARELRTREDKVIGREEATAIEETRTRELVEQTQAELQRVSGMTADEAKELLVRQLESDARRDAANLVKRLEHEARETAADKAKNIITQAIQRSAADHAIETTVSVVDLPSDDLKGRIIGREGRNIRALETATGVELIVDDTPGAIILSSFDPYRREIAKRAIEQLVADGRIHPRPHRGSGREGPRRGRRGDAERGQGRSVRARDS